MVENKLSFVDGASIHRAPMFSGINYHIWKIHMNFFIESIDQGIWNVIMNGTYIPKHVVDNKQVHKPCNLWTKEGRKFAQYDYIAKNIVTSLLNMIEFCRVSQ